MSPFIIGAYGALGGLAVGLVLGFRWGNMHVGIYRTMANDYAHAYLRTLGIEWKGTL